MRILLLLALMPIGALVANEPLTVRTISSAPAQEQAAPACDPASLGRKTQVIRSISTASQAIISAVAVGECLAAIDPDPDATYPAVRATASTAKAQRRRAMPEDDANIRECVAKAADVFRVEQSALYLILDVEGGTLGETSAPNTDGTVDIGPMQVNTWWVPKLEARGITRDALQNNLCINIMAGAWIYAQERRQSKTVAEAIARYHSPSPQHQRVYLGQIEKAIDRRLSAPALSKETVTPCAIGSPTCSVSSTSSSDTSPSASASERTSSGI